jgi:hypothetical protein
MKTIQRHLGMLLASAIAALSIWACAATREADGSWTFKFAPDMTINAFGLEDALGQLTDLLAKCITGNFSRPCSQNEMDAINEAIHDVVAAKKRLDKASVYGGGLTG